MSLALSKSRLLQRASQGGCGYGYSLLMTASTVRACALAGIRRPLKFQTNTVKHVSTIQDQSRLAKSVEDIRLESEFEANKNIREYLIKWQAIRPNILDPIREPDMHDPSIPWKGNMLNDTREAHDTGSDALHATEDDLADFSNLGDEGEGVGDFLEPGDLVALSS